MATFDITFNIAIHKGDISSEGKETDQVYPDSLFLEYGIIPNSPKHKIEIVFLNQTAQIKGFDTNFTSEILEHNQLAWVVFSLTNAVELDKKDITYIISNDMVVNFWTQKGKAKMGKKASKQKEIDNGTEEEENFWNSWIKMALSQEIVPPVMMEENKTEVNMLKNTVAMNPHFQHWIHILEDMKEIKEQPQEDSRNKKDEEENDTNNKKKRKGKADKEPQKDTKMSKTKKNSSKTEKTTISIKLAPLLAGKRTLKSQIMIKEQNFIHLAVFLSGKNLMEESIAEELNPLVVRINQVKNIPFQILNNLGIETILIKCKIFDEILKTEKRKLSGPNVLTDYAKILLTNEIPNCKLLEYIQTSQLFLTVVGIKTEISEICPVIEDLEVKPVAKKQKRKQQLAVKDDQPKTFSEVEKEIDIAVTHCNFSNLLNGQIFIEEDLPLFIAPFSIENPLHYANTKEKSEINQELMLHLSSVEVFVSFTLPLTLQSARLDPTGYTYYNRMLLLIKEDKVANSILENIVEFNAKMVPQIDLVEEKREENIMYDRENNNNENILTGFAVDSPHYTLIFIEGISDGFILQVYESVRNLPSIACKILYDNQLIFTSRLYSSLFPTPGITIIISTNALGKFLEKVSCYISEEKTKPCWQALKLIDALIKSNSIQTAIQGKLFPTLDQLTSLDINFGASRVKESDEFETKENV